MKQRVVAGVLWSLCGWYAGAAIAWILAIDPVLAPLLAIAAAWLVVADPSKILWSRGQANRVDRSAPTRRAGDLPEPA